MTDRQLLDRYAQEHDQQAFAELVRRHIDWVNSMAVRLTGDDALAADVTQAVFLLLSRKARSLRSHVALSGWLFNVTRYAAMQMVRNESIRRKHERRAAAMRRDFTETSEPQWTELSPMLDGLVSSLRSADREALLLRFYEQKSYPEIGGTLAISEEAARKRVDRAVDQLRAMFHRKGVTIGGIGLAALMNQSLVSPASAAVVAGATAAPATAASLSTAALVKSTSVMLSWIALRPVAIAVMVVLLGGITTALMMQTTTPAQQTAAVPPTTAPANVPMHFGRIITIDDKPLAGARVYLIQSDSWEHRKLVAETTTDADGRYQLPQIEKEGTWTTLLARAPGYGFTMIGASDTADDPAESTMRLPTELRARFADPDGQPISGLRVLLRRIQHKRLGGDVNFFPELKEELACTTDAQGECVFPDLPQDCIAVLEVPDERFAQLQYPHNISLDESATTIAPVIKLEKATTISGRIYFGDSGKPLAGARVHAESTDRLNSSRYGTALTDADGKYVMKQMTSGEYDVRITLPREVLATHAAPMLTNIRAYPGADPVGQDIKLVTGGIVRGRIYDRDTGAAITDTGVGVYSPAQRGEHENLQTMPVNNDGTYLLHVPPGSQYVYLFTDRLGWLTPQPRGFDINVADGQTATVDFPLVRDPAPTVKGIVVDSDGKPVAGAMVGAVFGDIPASLGARIVKKTDLQGNFVMSSVPNGASIRATKGRLTTAEKIVVDDRNRDLKLVLRKDVLASVLVRVSFPDGKPVVGAKVGLVQWDSQGGTGAGIDDRKSGTEGTAIFKNLRPDALYSFNATGKGLGSGSAPRMSLEPGKQAEVKITVPQAESFIAGMVVDEKGDPVPEVEVSIGGRQTSGQTVRTDINGRFRFENVVAGDSVMVNQRDERNPLKRLRYPAGTDNIIITHNPAIPP